MSMAEAWTARDDSQEASALLWAGPSAFDSTPPGSVASWSGMAQAKLVFRFTAPLVRHETALGVTHLLPVPDEAAAAWKKAKVRRLVGTVNGHPVKRALQNHADGGSFLLIGRSLLAEIGLTLKSTARLELSPDPTPDELDLPEEWLAVLAQDDAARQRWDGFTVGLKRSLAYYVSSAKKEPTRIKRSLELAKKLRTNGLSRDQKKPKGVAKDRPA